jgi:hypothetical protein
MKIDQSQKNAVAHESYKKHWATEKKSNGTWLSKAEYEKKTGKPGKS